jgi:hypothetical protein
MLPIKTGTDGALVVPLTQRWNHGGAPAPEQFKPANVMPPVTLASVEAIPIRPSVETIPQGIVTSDRPTVLNPLDFMRGNPYE